MVKSSLKGYNKIANYSTKAKAEKAKRALLSKAMSGTKVKIQKRVNKNRKAKGKKLVSSPGTNTTTYMLWAK